MFCCSYRVSKVFHKNFKLLSRNFQDFPGESFLSLLRMRETITICGLQRSARQQQQHFGFPHSQIFIKFSDKFWQQRHPEKRKSMAKIRTEVFIETSETLIIKRSRTFVRTWCEDCEREVSMLPL